VKGQKLESDENTAHKGNPGKNLGARGGKTNCENNLSAACVKKESNKHEGKRMLVPECRETGEGGEEREGRNEAPKPEQKITKCREKKRGAMAIVATFTEKRKGGRRSGLSRRTALPKDRRTKIVDGHYRGETKTRQKTWGKNPTKGRTAGKQLLSSVKPQGEEIQRAKQEK